MFLYYFLLYFLCTFFVTFFYTFHTLSLLLQRFHCVANDTVGTRYRATDSARIAAVSESLRWKRDSAASCLKTKFVIVLPRSAPSPPLWIQWQEHMTLHHWRQQKASRLHPSCSYGSVPFRESNRHIRGRWPFGSTHCEASIQTPYRTDNEISTFLQNEQVRVVTRSFMCFVR